MFLNKSERFRNFHRLRPKWKFDSSFSQERSTTSRQPTLTTDINLENHGLTLSLSIDLDPESTVKYQANFITIDGRNHEGPIDHAGY